MQKVTTRVKIIFEKSFWALDQAAISRYFMTGAVQTLTTWVFFKVLPWFSLVIGMLAMSLLTDDRSSVAPVITKPPEWIPRMASTAAAANSLQLRKPCGLLVHMKVHVHHYGPWRRKRKKKVHFPAKIKR
jgi:hypothetical protein